MNENPTKKIDDPSPRGGEDAPVGDREREPAQPKNEPDKPAPPPVKEPPRQAPPPMKDEPPAPDANPIDPRVFEKK